jgi:predicted peptidase
MLNVNSASGQDLSMYKKDIFTSKKGNLPYRVLLPKNYNPNVKYPLILFLHGSGERGNDNKAQLTHGADLFLKEPVRQNYPAVVVFPQCATDDSWSNYKWSMINGKPDIKYSETVDKIKHQELLKGLVKKLKKDFNLDSNRLYVGGLSMGAMGTFDMVKANPKLFAAAFAICGGANPKIAKRISKPSWWIFHGTDDDVVPAKYSQQIYDALKEVDADVKLTMYPGVKHDSWTNAFAEPDLLKWLFSKSLK